VLSGVFSALWPSVHRFCFRYLGQDADADDAAQRALEKLFAQATDYDPTRPVMAWALTLALWECRTIRRRNSRHRIEPLDQRLQSSVLSPEQFLEGEQLKRALDAAISQLSSADQETLSLVLTTEGFGRFENDSRFRKRKQRAVARLKEMWRKLYGT
jgi:RNA polymerase sigma-70 factor (ECF subfamily)